MSVIDCVIYANVNFHTALQICLFGFFFCILYHIAVYVGTVYKGLFLYKFRPLLLNMLSFQFPGNNGFSSPAFPSFLFISFHQPEGAALPPCFSVCVCVCVPEWGSVCMFHENLSTRESDEAFDVCLCAHMQEISIPLAPLVEFWGHPLLLGPPHLRLLWV